MEQGDALMWQNFQEAYGFIGNSLLKPMSQTSTVGLDPIFWEQFPDFGDPAIAKAIAACARYAHDASQLESAQAVENAAVEYTRLFVGPPKPAAPPWETMCRHEGITAGFGEPTFKMRKLLREAGLQLSNKNNQYEDHMGIELLYLSERCRRVAEDEAKTEPIVETEATAGVDHTLAEIRLFIEEHPLSWIESLRTKVDESAPEGYFTRLLALAEAVLKHQSALLTH